MKLKDISQTELDEILDKHAKWLKNEAGGVRANLLYTDLGDANLAEANLFGAKLHGANLQKANLQGAYLHGADLQYADLQYADLSGANLYDAKLHGANLQHADLREADLGDTDLRNANLHGADLSGANLRGVDLRGVKANELTTGFWTCPPEEGSFIGWKKCRENVIVKLLIPEDAKRSSATTRKCRCDKAFVLDIFGGDQGVSQHNLTFIYRKGETVSVDDFDDNRWNECSTGIHFFITREEAECY